VIGWYKSQIGDQNLSLAFGLTTYLNDSDGEYLFDGCLVF
jgi:hypothetical protein